MAVQETHHLVSYIFTYGPHEFISGQVRLPFKLNLLAAMAHILSDKYPELIQTNNGAGNCKNAMYTKFTTAGSNPALLKVSVSQNAKGSQAKTIETRYTVGNLAQYGYVFVRFHIDMPPSRNGYAHVDYKKRLYKFYNHYNAEKLVIVDQMLHDARGFEEELMDYLTMKYGPEPAPTVDLRYRDRLTAFYFHYNPSRVPEVDSILLSYSGMEEQLFGALVAKYGPEPIIMGSDAGSDDSFTYTNDTDKEDVDLYPLNVPLMPFIEPLHEHEIADHNPLDVSSDVHFWDNFVNQMPGESEEGGGEGMDCNQELLQQFMRSYPVLFQHIVTVTCPYKEQVFRGSDEFWTYVKARAEADTGVERADPSHIVRCVSSADPNSGALLLTRKEWCEMVDDWQAVHGLERRVKVGSVAIDPDPNAPLQMPERPLPIVPFTEKIETAEIKMQTVANGFTQTDPPPPPTPPPTPPPVIIMQPSPKQSPVKLVPTSPPGKSLPVAWPIATLAAPTAPSEDNEPPRLGDTAMEPYLRAALHEVKRRDNTGRAVMETQTGGWVPPKIAASPAVPATPTYTKAGPSPRKAVRDVREPQLTRPPAAGTSTDPLRGFGGIGGMPMVTARETPLQDSLDTRAHPARPLSLNASPLHWDASTEDDTDDLATFLRGTPYKRPSRNPKASRRGPQPSRHDPPLTESRGSASHVPTSFPSSSDEGVGKDKYWSSFLAQMQSLGVR